MAGLVLAVEEDNCYGEAVDESPVKVVSKLLDGYENEKGRDECEMDEEKVLKFKGIGMF